MNTDVIMPEMNGLELADSLVLFTSGYSHDVIAMRVGKLPEDMRHLAEPYTLTQLLGQVRESLDRDG